MDLKYIVPKMQETFGNLTFGAWKSDDTEFKDGRQKIVARTYSLFAEAQPADNIEVIVPAKVGNLKGKFEFEEPIRLVNPTIDLVAYRIGDRAYTGYVLHADNIESLRPEH